MAKSRKKKIIELAQRLGLRYIKDGGSINPLKIARDNGIHFKYRDLKDAFTGIIVHKNSEFMIFLNSKQLKSRNHPRARFAFCHELGHFFIPEHRKKLQRMKSLTYKGGMKNTRIEKEANYFAPNLLMPKPEFIKRAEKYELGIPQIYRLSQSFKASLICTCFHYVNCDMQPCILVRETNERIDATISNSAKSLIPKGGSVIVNSKRGTMDSHTHQLTRKIFYQEQISTLSSWISNIKFGSDRDMFVKEQRMDLGKHGCFTLIFPLIPS